MRHLQHFAFILILLAASCATPNMEVGDGSKAPQEQRVGEPVRVLIKGFGGCFVSCELDTDSTLNAGLMCIRMEAGEWERFLMDEFADGTIALKAANGKYVSCDQDIGLRLIADRDYPGDWERFTVVPKLDGKVAIRAWNGQYVTTDFELVGPENGALVGNRSEVYDWELFELRSDTAMVP